MRNSSRRIVQANGVATLKMEAACFVTETTMVFTAFIEATYTDGCLDHD